MTKNVIIYTGKSVLTDLALDFLLALCNIFETLAAKTSRLA